MAGKGDKPRNCFSTQFKQNFDEINWGDKTVNDLEEVVAKTDSFDGVNDSIQALKRVNKLKRPITGENMELDTR